MKKILIHTIIGLLGFNVVAQETVTGYVFEDKNHNGRKDSSEDGIAKVAVTNGTDVVLTNQEGKYILPIGEDNIISVIKPSGYDIKKNEDNLPQFFYIHKPKGSPNLKFKGVEPTGKLPKSVDFALTPSIENEDFTVLIFGDPQPYTQQQVDYFADGIVAEVEGIENVSFGLSLGDLVGNDLDLFNPYIQAVKRVGIPWYNLLGNHDINFDVEQDQLSDETYEAHFGPANYAFNYGKIHFLVLDDVLYPNSQGGGVYWGGFREDQFQFIENDLKHVPKDHLIVVAMHIPLSEPDGRNTFSNEDRERLFKLFKDFPNTLSLSAHTHIQRQDFFGREEGWRQNTPHHHYNVGTTSGDWYSGKLDEKNIPISTMRDGTPKGYALINFEGNKYNIDYKVAGKPDEYQMEIFAPKVVAKGKRARAGIYVNFFMGTKGDEVLYRIDDLEWQEMHYLEDYDPSYVEMVYEWDSTEELMPGRRSSNPVRSEHLWRGKIPAKLEVGEHSIEIKATDMYGKIHKAKTSYRIAEPIE